MPIVRRSSHAPGRRVRPLPLVVLAVVAALVAALVAVPVQAANPSKRPAGPPTPAGLGEFMGGLAQIESGGRYDVRNRSSGAYGKYQIMPFNWPVWAKKYLGNAKARQTPANQERVAAGKLTDLYWNFGSSWARTAYWWLTGKRGPSWRWSPFATHYVDGVMVGYRMRMATPPPGAVRRLDDNGRIVRYAGKWNLAHHPAYLESSVHYSTTTGAAVGVRFVGRGIRILGPVGPTRGRVAVYVDGVRQGVVDLWARSFRAQAVIVSLDWASRGEHWVELRVARTPARPVVAIDRIVIRG
jgi:transglycosylase-like protein with SLT domain